MNRESQCSQQSEIDQTETSLLPDLIYLKNAWVGYRKEIVKNYPELYKEFNSRKYYKKYLGKYEIIQDSKRFVNLKLFEGLQKYMERLDDKTFKYKFLFRCSRIFSKPFFKEIITLILHLYSVYDKDKQILNEVLLYKLIDQCKEEMAWIINNLYPEWFQKLQLLSRYQPNTLLTSKIAQKYEHFLKQLVKMIFTVIKMDRLHTSL